MTVSLGAVANVYNEIHALPGWLENVTSWADHVSVYHAGPGGRWSDDGTVELLEKWKIPIHRGSIDDGFGIVRTATVRSSPCEWVMLLDADERFWPMAQVISCSGEGTPADEVGRILQEYDRPVSGAPPSNFENVHKLGANLTVSFGEAYNQIAWMRDFLQYGALDAVSTIRRHWHDFSWKRPTQNWHALPDYQTRIVRNVDGIGWDANVKMHEQLLGAPNRYQPNQTHGPFFDHYHMHFKRLEPMQRAHAVAIYDAIHWGQPVPSREEFLARKR